MIKLLPVIIFFCLLPFALQAQDVPKRPDPARLVNDLADVLTAEEERALENKLVAYDDSTTSQIVLVTLSTLNDYPIEEYSLKLFRDWGIGTQEHNNGVLVLAVIGDRKIRIETGYGLEGAIPDITANEIITYDLAPAFRQENYYQGFEAATNSLIAAAAGEYQAPEGGRKKERKGSPLGFIIILIVLVLLFSRGGRGGGGGFMSRRGFGPVIFPGGGLFGGGGGGFGGGGFSGGFGGFGGGSSGGGGASGSW